MLYRTKTLRVLWPEIAIPTLAGTPALTMFLTAVLLKSWKSLFASFAPLQAFSQEPRKSLMRSPFLSEKKPGTGREFLIPQGPLEMDHFKQFSIRVNDPRLLVLGIRGLEANFSFHQINLIPREAKDFFFSHPRMVGSVSHGS
jgi:hypothetical protein